MIELSPDLNLILSDLCLLIFKTTGREVDEPELKLNWEQHHFTQVLLSSAPGTERGTMVFKQHQPGIPGNESKCIYVCIYDSYIYIFSCVYVYIHTYIYIYTLSVIYICKFFRFFSMIDYYTFPLLYSKSLLFIHFIHSTVNPKFLTY